MKKLRTRFRIENGKVIYPRLLHSQEINPKDAHHFEGGGAGIIKSLHMITSFSTV